MDLSPFVGLPWADRGRDPRTGVDCWGLACAAYAGAMHITLPSYSDEYRAMPERDRAELQRLIDKHRGEWRQIDVGQERGGDLIILRVAGAACHIGVVAQPGMMLTIRRGQSSAIESYRSVQWRSRIDTFLRHRHAEF